MKRILLTILLSVAALGQNTTPNLGLTLPAPNQIGWSQAVNQNFSIIDGVFGGSTGLPGFLVTNPGVFTNTQMNLYDQSIIAGCNPSTEFQATQGVNFDTEAITGCVTMPVTATVHQVSGVAGYAVSNLNVGTSGGAVGGYFSARQLANNGSAFGMNSIVQDFGGTTGTQLASSEIDVNFLGSPARVWGIIISGASTGTSPSGIGNSSGIFLRAPGTAGSGVGWQSGIDIEQGASTVAGIAIGPTTSSNGVPSQNLQFISRQGGGTLNTKNMSLLADGNLSLGTPVQQLKLADQGACTMAAGTCSAQSLSATYGTAPICVATWTGTGALAGSIKIASTTTTVTPSSSNGADTAQVNWVCFGT